MGKTFERSGLAAASDLRTPEWSSIYQALEDHQKLFLSRQDEFRTPGYEWPRNALIEWSRVWEYPYVFHHLRSFSRLAPRARIVDLGSAVTFFPLTVAKLLELRVACSDIVPAYGADLLRAKGILGWRGELDYRLSDGFTLPFEDGEADALYSVSVLEHIPHRMKTIAEIRRVLKPGGFLVLTLDLDGAGWQGLGAEELRELRRTLDDSFELVAPFDFTHPDDRLRRHTVDAPGDIKRRLVQSLFLAKQRVKPMFGRRPVPVSEISVLGLAARKRA